MATFNDPITCFAPLEIIERLLEIRAELGFAEVLYVDNSVDLAEFLDAYGFDVYAFSSKNEKKIYVYFCSRRNWIATIVVYPRAG